MRYVTDWTTFPALLQVKKKVEAVTGATFNYVVVQYYPTGKVKMNPHRDREMKPGTVIAGLSVGTRRRLTMSRTGCLNKSFILAPGSVYELKPPTNDFWAHAIEPGEGERFS